MAQNMSYCAAENTRDCMEQLLNLIETGEKNDVFDEQPPHNYEARAIEDIAYLAKELSNACNHLIDTHGN
jgi:hypothetical protein